jgi:hypothetical protein
MLVFCGRVIFTTGFPAACQHQHTCGESTIISEGRLLPATKQKTAVTISSKQV